MRSHPNKEFGLWLDHSGNYLRFRDDWDELYEDGVKELDSSGEKAHREPTEKKKKESKCPKCSLLWPKGTDTCPSCGYVREKRNEVSAVAGEMVEFLASETVVKETKQDFYSQLLFIANERSYNPHWASHKYRERFGVWPKGLVDTPIPPSITTMKWIRSKQIAWAKRKVK
jgi:hypothetical protein